MQHVSHVKGLNDLNRSELYIYGVLASEVTRSQRKMLNYQFWKRLQCMYNK